jgi:hypothetical protein
MSHYACTGCGNVTLHAHLHNTAHGIAETHMAGSERFICMDCSHHTWAWDADANRFPFVLDVPPKKGVPVKDR